MKENIAPKPDEKQSSTGTQIINKPLQLNTVNKGESTDNVLVYGADNEVKSVPRNEFGDGTSQNLQQILDNGNTSTTGFTIGTDNPDHNQSFSVNTTDVWMENQENDRTHISPNELFISRWNSSGSYWNSIIGMQSTYDSNIGKYYGWMAVGNNDGNGVTLRLNPEETGSSQLYFPIADPENYTKTIVTSVNGNLADANGNVVVSAGGGRFGIEDNTSTVDRKIDLGNNKFTFDSVSEYHFNGSAEEIPSITQTTADNLIDGTVLSHPELLILMPRGGDFTSDVDTQYADVTMDLDSSTKTLRFLPQDFVLSPEVTYRLLVCEKPAYMTISDSMSVARFVLKSKIFAKLPDQELPINTAFKAVTYKDGQLQNLSIGINNILSNSNRVYDSGISFERSDKILIINGDGIDFKQDYVAGQNELKFLIGEGIIGTTYFGNKYDYELQKNQLFFAQRKISDPSGTLRANTLATNNAPLTDGITESGMVSFPIGNYTTTMPISVNGVLADIYGNIEISGSGKELDLQIMYENDKLRIDKPNGSIFRIFEDDDDVILANVGDEEGGSILQVSPTDNVLQNSVGENVSGIYQNDGSLQVKQVTLVGTTTLEFEDPIGTAVLKFPAKINGVYTLATEPESYTVATLPSGNIGDMAYVTDATAPTYLGTLTGGGSVVCPVFYNGTAWVAH